MHLAALSALFALAAGLNTCKGGFKFRSANPDIHVTTDFIGRVIKNQYEFVTNLKTQLVWSNYCTVDGCNAIDGTYTITTEAEEGTGDGYAAGCWKNEKATSNSIGTTWIKPS